MKFKVYDKVWVIYADSVHVRTIFKRTELVYGNGETECYYTVGKEIEKRDQWRSFDSNQVYATKQELLNSL